MLEKINNFIKRGEEIKVLEYHPALAFPAYVSGPKFDVWMNDIHVFNERYLKDHPLYDSISKTYSTYKKKSSSSCDDMLGYLRTLASDAEFFNTRETASKEPDPMISNKVFIVHGHDTAAKLEVARTLEKAGFESIILHEQGGPGKTIIEKIEAFTDVAFAVVLYTPCDIGRAKEAQDSEENYRARQNVVFEHGYLIGRLSRYCVSALVKGNIETPGDISGVVYIPMDEAGGWKIALAKDMKSAGLQVDMNKFF